MNYTEYFETLFAEQEEYLGNEKEVNKIEPLVSVFVITYQHAPYIAECLDSILMQETNFPYEIVIGEDQSHDGTREICKSYAEKHPDKIRLFLRDRNKSVIKSGNRNIYFNGKLTIKSCVGKYIAWCEGDDYWTDQLKLQKQVDFLEMNSDYGLVCTRVDKYFQKAKVSVKKAKNKNKYFDLSFNDLLRSNPVKSCTTCFRTILLQRYFNEVPLEKIIRWRMGDYPIWAFISLHSKIRYINYSSATYPSDDPSGINTTVVNKAKHKVSSIDVKRYFVLNYDLKFKHLVLLIKLTLLTSLEYSLKILGNKLGLYEPDKRKTINKAIDKMQNVEG